MAMHRLYAPISKTEELDDGTLKVWGYASSGTVDSDGETITADAMKAALPDYLKFGAVRDMHKADAVGTAIEAEVQDDGRTWFGAHVVDPVAVLKVRNNVFKGFSIGGRITGRDPIAKTTITGLKLVEVSLVDRPANPDAVFTMFKAEIEAEAAPALSAIDEMSAMIAKGETTPEAILDLIKAAQVVPAAEAAAEVGEDAPAATEVAQADDVAKGMNHVCQLAYLLKEIGYLTADQVAEATREGDSSLVPAALHDWLTTGAAILCNMVAEEAAELVADAVPDEGILVDTIEMAAAADDLEKAGARNSKSDTAHLQGMHDSAVAMGASCGTDKADTTDDLAKLAHADALAKAVTAATEPLAKRIAELEAMPAIPKAVLKVVGKEADTIIGTPSAPVAQKAAREEDPTITLMKNALSNPIRIG
jgi:hypothetical protein